MIRQLYPFPHTALQEVLAHYRRVEEVTWVQEEPQNLGAWSFVAPRLRQLLQDTGPLTYCGRDAAASPAAGLHRVHQKEQEGLINQTLGLTPAGVAPMNHSGGRSRKPAVKEDVDGDQR
jgi:2-oxoglutarate dehydrogenase complex dehydrogenase (E1) component-like enzyme